MKGSTKKNGVQCSMSVHKAVLLTFVGPPEDPTYEVLHGPNHDPADNALCNLRWGSHEENNEDMWRNNGYCGYEWELPPENDEDDEVPF